MHKGGEDDIEKKTEKKNEREKRKTKKKNKEKQGRRQKWENRGENKKKTRTKGGETEKRRRRRAFFSRCLHYYLRLPLRFRLHQVKSSSSLYLCVIVARNTEGNLITFALCSARVGWATHACCPARSIAWASDQAGPAGSSPPHPCWLG